LASVGTIQRMPTVIAELREKNGEIRNDGMAPSPRSPMLCTRRFCRSSAFATEIEIGVFCRFVSRFCAVTITSESPAPASASPVSAAHAPLASPSVTAADAKASCFP
jgi:hypothetical protein